RWSLLGHFSAAAWGLFWIGGLPPLTVFGFFPDLGLLGSVLAAFYLVWLLNLYNFMDGIDGIASVEAISVCLCGALIFLFVG
ncbi:glycosyl transferase, partial [Pseudomonas aeruginosa]